MASGKTNVTIVVYGINRAVSHEWTVDYIDQEKFNLSFVLMNQGDSVLEKFLADRGVPCLRVPSGSKKLLFLAVWRIFRFLRKQRTHVVHTHLMEANLAGLAAAWLAGVKSRIYTRHHSTYHHVYFPSVVKYDRWVNRMATRIIAISEVVRDVLVDREGVPPSKVTLIPHGFHFDELLRPDPDRVAGLRKKYNAENRRPVIGVIARYTNWKGIQHIIPAYKKLLADEPDALMILANAKGDYTREIREMLASLPDGSYAEIEFEPDFAALYGLFDVYVHTPIDDHSEAYGQTYVEALVAGVPSVFTLSGIARNFIRHERNALVVDYGNPDQVYAGLRRLLDDKSLADKLAVQGREDALERFPLQHMIRGFEMLYRPDGNKIKIIYIISLIEKALIYEWLAAHFRVSEQFEVSYILLNPGETELGRILRDLGCRYQYLKYRGKWDSARTMAAIYRILRREQPDMINTNLFDASFTGQVAGWLARVPVRIHSRHYSSQHHDYYPNALKYDRLINRICTHIQVASGMVKNLMVEREGVPGDKIRVIHYGFRVGAFEFADPALVEKLRYKYFGKAAPFPVIGVISRFLQLKGIQYIVPAFKMLLERFPNAHLMIANAKGPYKQEVGRMLSGLPDGSYTTITFEKDIAALYRLFDVFVHVPVDPWAEAFGQIYIEALVSGVPSVFTMSGIAHDVIRNEENALVVDYKQAAPIHEAMIRLVTDKQLAGRISEKGKEVVRHFDFDRMARETDEWLGSLVGGGKGGKA